MTGGDGAVTLDVQDFVCACIERAGGQVDAGPDGRLDALLPPALEAAAGGRSWVTLALSQEALEGGAEPALPGSPFLDALIEQAGARGMLAEAHLPAGRLRRRGLRAEAEAALRFSNCRTRYLEDEAEVRLAATAQFDFRVSFVSAERRERLYAVPVSLVSGHHDPALAARLERAELRERTDLVLPRAPRVPAREAYESARTALRALVAADAARQQERARRRFAAQFARTDEYYARSLEGLERRRERELGRVVAGAPASTAERGESASRAQGRNAAAGFVRRMEAVQHERERKLRELGETYGIRTRARLVALRLLWQPKVFFQVLIDRGASTRALTLVYDGWLERLEPPGCDGCRHPATRLRAMADARLLCPACADRLEQGARSA